MVTYPADLIPELRRLWETIRMGKQERVPELPGDEVLLDLLNVAYHASFLTEEQRRIGFRLLYCRKDELIKHPRYLGQKTSPEPIEFGTPLFFSVNEILRLAPALDYHKVLICVGPVKSEAEFTYHPIKIWGVIDTGSSWWDFTQSESSQGYPPPNFLTVTTTEPGQLILSRQGYIIISLRNGRVNKPRELNWIKGPIANFFKPAEAGMIHEIRNQLRSKYMDNAQDFDEEVPRKEYHQYLRRILNHIRNQHHGGTLLVVPDYLTVDDPRLKDRLNIKYPCHYHRGWKLIIEYVVLYRLVYDLNFPSGEESDRQLLETLGNTTAVLKDEVKNLEDAITDSVSFVASLAGVDGAVLITDRLRVLGFGAEVIAHSPSLRFIRSAENEDGDKGPLIPFDAYGTRHRSAFRFCSSYEDAMTFVISSDGGIKGVKRVGADLAFWPDINYGVLGI